MPNPNVLKAREDMTTRNRAEAGFALIVALLALLVLTLLGLTLALLTSTELSIAANHRFGEQARYNAEAGFEVARDMLSLQPDWSTLMRDARPQWDEATVGQPVPNPYPQSDPRDYEGGSCDVMGNGMGFGAVLVSEQSDYQGIPVEGTYTIWLRRDYQVLPNGMVQDQTDSTRAVVTVEGTAPYRTTGAFQSRNRAVRYIQAVVTSTVESPCEVRRGQAGSAASGANFGACEALRNESLTRALGLVAEPTEYNVR
jgi:hypothetical protein